ncbi:MAG: glycoside hydrolase family 2 [Bryobacterales bacterium]|nr:glycoside hydrolase family 2 [Bryobacterales bacterium]
MWRFSVILLCFTFIGSAADIPRPEYPQPQFERERWLSLNGTWDFEFDDANAGEPRTFGRKILVPYAFETKMSGIGDTGFHPWVWYRRTVNVPDAWRGQRILLHFGAVDYRAWVWVNGKLAGSHEGGHTPFRFDITDLAKPGTNTITVKAEDPPQDRFIPRGKQYWELKSRGIFYTRTTGIWQPVWLEATGDAYLDKVRITSFIDGRIRMEAKVLRAKPNLEFVAKATFRNQEVAGGQVAVRGPGAHLELRVPNPQLWMVNSPNLYDLTFELRSGGTVLDRVKSYTGLREIAISNGRVWINGRSVYLKWVLDQGYWPESTITPPTDDAMVFDIKATQDMGFNGCRKHQKVEDPRFLYWADKMGFLVSGEMANAYEFDPDYAARFTREWLEAVERDYNHPSVIMWVPINESWGTPNLRDPQQQNHLRSNYWLTKSLDSTRPVVENDGWEHVDTLDLFTIHDYAASGAALLKKYKDLGKRGARIPDNGRAIFAPGNSYNGAPFLLSEFGGIAYIPSDAKVPGDAWGYAGVEKTRESAIERLRGIYEAIAQIPAFAGFCYTQITDVEQEVNGLLTYDRKMKFDPKVIKEINALIP